MEKILILGGYGKAGKAITYLLAEMYSYPIIISGRNERKATVFANKVKVDFPESHVEATKVDVYKENNLKAIVNNCKLVIVAIPLELQNTLNLIEAVLDSRQAHYIDLSPDSEKYKAFKFKESAIKHNEHVFLLDAGFIPGLPVFLTRWLIANCVFEIDEVIIEGIYRDPYIPEGGIKDILNHKEPAGIWKNGQWQKASYLHFKLLDFPGGFGKEIAMPIILPELKNIPADFNINKMVYYHAGINWLANIIMMGWQYFLHRIIPIHLAIKLFKIAIKYFTKKPYGGVINVIAKTSNHEKSMMIHHKNLYKATAIPVVASAHLLLQSKTNEAGSFFMGEWVNSDEFVHLLQKSGMMITCKN